MPALVFPLYDLLIALVFAAIGRRNHGEGDALTGIAMTAWPFLVGVAVGWGIVLVARRSLDAGARIPNGVIVWLSTVVVGMVLRHLTDRGVAASFVIVTLVFNGVLMLGWRVVAHLMRRRRQPRAHA